MGFFDEGLCVVCSGGRSTIRAESEARETNR